MSNRDLVNTSQDATIFLNPLNMSNLDLIKSNVQLKSIVILVNEVQEKLIQVIFLLDSSLSPKIFTSST